MTKPLTRRHFLRLAGLAATGTVLWGPGCTAQPSATPSAPPTTAPTSTPAPTAPPRPTSTPTVAPTVAVRRPEIIEFYPDAPSRVVRTHHAGVWDGETLVPEAIRQMLDASITALTGLDDPLAAWQALFAPTERIAIKVNVFTEDSTHVPLVMTVAKCLQEAGVPGEQIVIFDRYTLELESAGYTINRDGPGVRCYGSDMGYTTGWTLDGTDIALSNILLACNALINIPILKTASAAAGISFALKNHYGTFDKPALFHGNRFAAGVSGLNALPPLKDRARLVIGDLLTMETRRERYGFQIIGGNGALLMAFDPVALDAVGLRIADEVLTTAGRDTTAMKEGAVHWLAACAELGLGTNDPAHIELTEVNLG